MTDDGREGRGSDGPRSSSGALIEGAELHRLLIESVRDYAIFALDSTGHVLTWNLGAHRLKQYDAEEIIGRHFSVFYPPEALAIDHPAYELREAERTGSIEDEGWRVRKDGSRFWANVIITALRNDAGDLVGFAKVTRDLTERRESQQRAIEDARRMAEAEAANKAKSEFLTALSHELRTPLNAIGGYCELLAMGLRGPVTEQQVHDLGRIRQSQQHLLALVNDLLNYTRVESGAVEYRMEPVPMGEALDHIAAMIRPQADGKNLELEVEECTTGDVAWADGPKVQQILLNLVTNAVKFTPSGGRVTLSCNAERDRVRVRVSDTGPGIPESMQSTMFEPFVQLGRTHTSEHEGIGLGLAISRDLARAMDGDITVTSVEGRGATFELTLPRSPAR
jgi:PAS domain S-box-containing protein